MYIIVGDSGKGKSAFINCIAKQEVAVEGHEDLSTTSKAEIFETDGFLLVDTRGFNDTRDLDDKDILQEISNLFLMGKHRDISLINGIIYIHDANDATRFHY